ncbi:hypothetical protein DN412_11930 [Cupriavidus lacunae]|uniref:Uncharacterized protein n=1 Tax=Cupriavidus lacunae TaxID=2666307 RepID=A0A370NWU8_9BURK|nr:hypothetical protein DN412_11930 [Cupriavidus lacunae]
MTLLITTIIIRIRQLFVRTWVMSDTDVTASTRCIEVDGDRFAYRRIPSSPWRSSALPCTATTIIK